MHLLFSAYLIFFIAARQKIGHFNAILQFFVCFVFVCAILYIKIFIRYRVGRAQPSIRFLRIYSLGDSPVYCLNILLK